MATPATWFCAVDPDHAAVLDEETFLHDAADAGAHFGNARSGGAAGQLGGEGERLGDEQGGGKKEMFERHGTAVLERGGYYVVFR